MNLPAVKKFHLFGKSPERVFILERHRVHLIEHNGMTRSNVKGQILIHLQRKKNVHTYKYVRRSFARVPSRELSAVQMLFNEAHTKPHFLFIMGLFYILEETTDRETSPAVAVAVTDAPALSRSTVRHGHGFTTSRRSNIRKKGNKLIVARLFWREI
ncbi:hypothetical protein KQX54_015439 [Cotesia glomerata]|uniref:Uncharacterized protein n=1 Tax=Cotesia glomerata TaxID=32391 RepID=A0AAV7IEC6_COTGL|nr:hypothetical protein KQX54_015439 [Cotesia glomerata]